MWVRIHGLSQEYWHPKIVFEIVSSIGTPICIYSTSNKPHIDRSFGNFVRVLVDIELMNEIRDKILVERFRYAFFVEIEYEKMSDICHFCKALGHSELNCKRKAFREERESGRKTDHDILKASNRHKSNEIDNHEK